MDFDRHKNSSSPWRALIKCKINWSFIVPNLFSLLACEVRSCRFEILILFDCEGQTTNKGKAGAFCLYRRVPRDTIDVSLSLSCLVSHNFVVLLKHCIYSIHLVGPRASTPHCTFILDLFTGAVAGVECSSGLHKVATYILYTIVILDSTRTSARAGLFIENGDSKTTTYTIVILYSTRTPARAGLDQTVQTGSFRSGGVYWILSIRRRAYWILYWIFSIRRCAYWILHWIFDKTVHIGSFRSETKTTAGNIQQINRSNGPKSCIQDCNK
jgi:hypothetical protein